MSLSFGFMTTSLMLASSVGNGDTKSPRKRKPDMKVDVKFNKKKKKSLAEAGVGNNRHLSKLGIRPTVS